ncbi:MAG: hypothetical protein ABEI96_01375 [Haloarculaceae archaeon]
MTEESSAESDGTRRAGREPMKAVSHTDPYTDSAFGSGPAFQRGPTVAADGGERDAAGEDEDEDDPFAVEEPSVEEQTMKDVSHTPPHDEAEDVNRVFERGTEGRDETV